MRTHHCPHCGGAHKAHGSRKHLQCPHCGGSFFSSLASVAKKALASPMVQNLAKSAATSLAHKYAPGLTQKVQSVLAHPMAQSAMKHVGLGRRRHHGAMLPLGTPSAGEVSYAAMRASGRHRRRHHGGLGATAALDVASSALGAIPGLSDALGLAPPPPPRASFQAVRAGPMVAARSHGVGRGMHHKVMHHCPHCGGAKHSAAHVRKHKCRHCGGSFFSSLASVAKKALASPMVQNLAKSAVSSLANKYAPGLTQKVQSALAHPMVQSALAHPMAQSAMKHVGLGKKRTRAPTAHALAVKSVMAQHPGMKLGEASKYVKMHGLA